MIDEQRFAELNEAVAGILRRQQDFEDRLAHVEGTKREAVSSPEPPVIERRTVEEPPVVPGPPLIPIQDEVPRARNPAIETKVGLTVVNRVGVVTLILGVAFFFKWAADNNWIGPVGRVLLGLLAGFAALGIADYLWRKSQQIFAQGVTGAGLAIFYLSVYAAFGFYHLVPLLVAFAFMASATALAYALALRYESAAIAALGFFGGYLTPLLLSSGEDHSWFLLSYVLLLNIAVMRLVKQKQWRLLERLAFAATAIIYFAWFNETHRGTAAATAGALAYYGLFASSASELVVLPSQALTALAIWAVWRDAPGPFFALEVLVAAAGIVYYARRKTPAVLSMSFASFWTCSGLFLLTAVHASVGAQFLGLSAGFLLFLLFRGTIEFISNDAQIASAQSLTILAADGVVYFSLGYLLLQSRYYDWLGLLAICVSGAYLGLAAFLRKNGPILENVNSRPLLVALGMAIAFVTLAIPIQLTGYRITIGWAIQGAAVTWIATRFKSQRALVLSACIFVLVAIRLAIFDSTLSWSPVHPVTSFLNARFATFAISAASAFAAARWVGMLDRRLALGEYLGAHIALLAGLTLETLLSVQMTATPESLLSVETVSVSILFAAYALLLVGIGVTTRTVVNRLAGLVLIGFVIAKLYVFDVWQLDRFYRIAAFVVLGLLLISTSFLYSRFRPLIDSLLRRD